MLAQLSSILTTMKQCLKDPRRKGEFNHDHSHEMSVCLALVDLTSLLALSLLGLMLEDMGVVCHLDSPVMCTSTHQ